MYVVYWRCMIYYTELLILEFMLQFQTKELEYWSTFQLRMAFEFVWYLYFVMLTAGNCRSVVIRNVFRHICVRVHRFSKNLEPPPNFRCHKDGMKQVVPCWGSTNIRHRLEENYAARQPGARELYSPVLSYVRKNSKNPTNTLSQIKKQFINLIIFTSPLYIVSERTICRTSICIPCHVDLMVWSMKIIN